MSFERGFLRKPAVKALLETWPAAESLAKLITAGPPKLTNESQAVADEWARGVALSMLAGDDVVEVAIVGVGNDLHNAVEKPGPHQCCADWVLIEACDGETDSMHCGICDRRWTRPCVVGDLVATVER